MSAPTPADLVALMPFALASGVRLDEATPEMVTGRMDWSAQRCTAGGVLHGGALLTLADSAGAVCAFLNLPPGCSTATLSTTANLVRGVREGHVVATARPLHVGRSTIVVQTDLRDAADRLVGQVTQTQAVIGPAAAAAG